jgi:hypothetical protein
MAYKEQIKINELGTKIRIVRDAKRRNVPIVQIAKANNCHRHTVTNILTDFEQLISPEDQRRLLRAEANLKQEDLSVYMPLLNKSRKPKGNKRKAPKAAENELVRVFNQEKKKVGVKRMCTIISRRYQDHPAKDTTGVRILTSGQMKGAYKRNNLVTKKVRSKNREVRHLYDYEKLGCFEKTHYDVKYVLDQHALPEEIYQLLSGKEIPRYEWNFIDAKSRTRFLAFSYERPSEFGFRYLLFVLLYIRYLFNAYLGHIVVGKDNGMEFCGGSQRKEDDWNLYLSLVNAHGYSYDKRFDVRKNLIERSHLSDDEELYIPRGIYMGTKKTFMQEASKYQYYWNFERHHSGIGMHDRTPYEVLKASGLTGAKRIAQFPVLILDDVIDAMRECTRTLEFEYYARTHTELIQKSQTDQKTRRIIEDKFFLPIDVHNVLTQYQNSFFIS